ncbi:MAG: hypothetical protein A2X64_00095 [Ignavibacteria bacterium GWF2_33_9]|nr:MAG: hypothetical protein A2X64_00095 [Ignavibacteria bacterium GWF2_33_9]
MKQSLDEGKMKNTKLILYMLAATMLLFGGCTIYRAYPDDQYWMDEYYNGYNSGYVYFPQYNLYYDFYNHGYYYSSGGNWCYSTKLPIHYRHFHLGRAERRFYTDNFYFPWRDKFKHHKGNHNNHSNGGIHHFTNYDEKGINKGDKHKNNDDDNGRHFRDNNRGKDNHKVDKSKHGNNNDNGNNKKSKKSNNKSNKKKSKGSGGNGGTKRSR